MPPSLSLPLELELELTQSLRDLACLLEPELKLKLALSLRDLACLLEPEPELELELALENAVGAGGRVAGASPGWCSAGAIERVRTGPSPMEFDA